MSEGLYEQSWNRPWYMLETDPYEVSLDKMLPASERLGLAFHSLVSGIIASTLSYTFLFLGLGTGHAFPPISTNSSSD